MEEPCKGKREIQVTLEGKPSALVLVGLLLALSHLVDRWLIWQHKFLKIRQLVEGISQTMNQDPLEALVVSRACARETTPTQEQLSLWIVTNPIQK